MIKLNDLFWGALAQSSERYKRLRLNLNSQTVFVCGPESDDLAFFTLNQWGHCFYYQVKGHILFPNYYETSRETSLRKPRFLSAPRTHLMHKYCRCMVRHFHWGQSSFRHPQMRAGHMCRAQQCTYILPGSFPFMTAPNTLL